MIHHIENSMKLKDKVYRAVNNLYYKSKFNQLINDNSGMGVVEIILIIIVLVGLVVVFRTQITKIVNTLFSKLTNKINTF